MPASPFGTLSGGQHQGTVIVVTHDRWFARSFEGFLVFTSDGSVREATQPVWD